MFVAVEPGGRPRVVQAQGLRETRHHLEEPLVNNDGRLKCESFGAADSPVWEERHGRFRHIQRIQDSQRVEQPVFTFTISGVRPRALKTWMLVYQLDADGEGSGRFGIGPSLLFEAFESGVKETGRKAAWALYNLGVEKLR